MWKSASSASRRRCAEEAAAGRSAAPRIKWNIEEVTSNGLTESMERRERMRMTLLPRVEGNSTAFVNHLSGYVL